MISKHVFYSAKQSLLDPPQTLWACPKTHPVPSEVMSFCGLTWARKRLPMKHPKTIHVWQNIKSSHQKTMCRCFFLTGLLAKHHKKRCFPSGSFAQPPRRQGQTSSMLPGVRIRLRLLLRDAGAGDLAAWRCGFNWFICFVEDLFDTFSLRDYVTYPSVVEKEQYIELFVPP